MAMKKIGIFLLVISVVILSFSGCTRKGKKELWIYTSIYKDMIEMMEPDVDKAFPNTKIHWFASGSEKVGAKIQAELAANQLQADILMTADPFFYIELKNKGLLYPYESPNAHNIPPALKDPDRAFVTQRVPVVVMVYHRELLKPSDAPKSFLELTDKKWKKKIAMGSPLESGTTFTAVATLSKKYGWDYFKKLRENEVFSSGGNSTVRQKLELREYPVGIILLENILQAQSQGSPLEAIYPSDGAILVPSPVAIFKRTEQLEEAKKFIDFLFSEVGQQAMVKANMYSPNPMIGPPENAKTFGFILKNSFPWTHEFALNVYQEHQKIKETFSKVMYEQ